MDNSTSALASLKILLIGSVILCLVAQKTWAAPWMDTGDTRLRHYVRILADAGVIRVPVNTWPLMWSGIIADINLSRGKLLSSTQREAVDQLTHAFDVQTRRNRNEVELQVAERIAPLRGFGDVQRGEVDFGIKHSHIAERWAARLELHRVEDPTDGEEERLDGSYISTLWGNWAWVAGSVDRWWGPGRQSGLILSNNARPVPGVSVQRNYSDPFESRWLNWLGPWQLTAFAGQLEEDRDVSRAKLLGMRVDFRPLRWLELGVSRTAQWGGDGRPESLGSLKDLVLGRDNLGSDGIDARNEPGNQLGGFDWRATQSFRNASVEFYGEVVGEDEAGGMPSRKILTLGLGGATRLPKISGLKASYLRVYIESTDTATDRKISSDSRYGYAYEHSIYSTGYRYKGQAIGANIDNDARSDTLGIQWYPGARNSLELKIQLLDFRANTRKTDSLTNSDSNGLAGSLGWRYQHEYWTLSLAYEYYSGRLDLKNFETGDDRLAAQIQLSW